MYTDSTRSRTCLKISELVLGVSRCTDMNGGAGLPKEGAAFCDFLLVCVLFFMSTEC